MYACICGCMYVLIAAHVPYIKWAELDHSNLMSLGKTYVMWVETGTKFQNLFSFIQLSRLLLLLC